MTSVWLSLALFAHLFTAAAFVIDKYLLAGKIPRPFAYSFWVAVLSFVAVTLVPFGVYVPDALIIIIALVSGVTFFLALFFLYRAIRKTDVSIASPQVSSVSVVCMYFLSIWFLGDPFSLKALFSFGVVMVGIIFLGKTSYRVWREALLGGVFFGISLVTLKISFELTDFVNGFFWSRVGFVGIALATLVAPRAREEVLHSYSKSSSSSKFLFLLSKFIAGLGFLIFNFAISLGNVAMINALLGMQFVFIFILSLIFGRKIPALAEDNAFPVLVRKLSGFALVILGLIILFS